MSKPPVFYEQSADRLGRGMVRLELYADPLEIVIQNIGPKHANIAGAAIDPDSALYLAEKLTALARKEIARKAAAQ